MESEISLKVTIDRESRLARFLLVRDDGACFEGMYDWQNAMEHNHMSGAIINSDNFLVFIEKLAVLGSETCEIEYAYEESELYVTLYLVTQDRLPSYEGGGFATDNLRITCERTSDGDACATMRKLRAMIGAQSKQIHELARKVALLESTLEHKLREYEERIRALTSGTEKIDEDRAHVPHPL